MLTLVDHESGYTFPLTAGCVDAANDLMEVFKGSRHNRIQRLHAFVSRFLFARDQSHETENSNGKWNDVIECFLAIYCVKEDGTFKRPDEATQVFAHLKYHCKGATLYEGLQHLAEFDNDPYKYVLLTSLSTCNSTTCFRAVEFYAMKNLQAGVTCPYNSIVEYQRYASAIVLSSTTPPTIRLNADATKISYKEYTLDVQHWISGLHAIYQKIKDDMRTLLQGHNIPLDIPENIPDDWTVTTRKYSWLNNGNFVKENRPLMKILLADKDLNLGTLDRSGHIQFNAEAMLKFMQKSSDINGDLSVLSFATPGQPVRAAEWVDMKIKNSTRPRGYFRNNNESWFVTRRVKSENLLGKESFFPIKINPLLAELLEMYLLVIREVEKDFAWMLWGEECFHLYDEYLWVQMGGVMNEKTFSTTLQRLTNLHCGVGLSIRPYRQLIIAVARTYLGSEAEIEEDDEDDLLARQSNHSPYTRLRLYGNEDGHLPCLSSDTLLRYGRVSEAWWRLVNFKPGSPPVLPLKTRRRLQQDLCGTDSDESIGSPATLDMAKITEHLMATISTSISQLKVDLTSQIQSSVAQGIAEVLQKQSLSTSLILPSLLQPPPPPPPPPSHQQHLAQPSTSFWTSHDLDDLYTSPPIVDNPSNIRASSPVILVPSTPEPPRPAPKRSLIHHHVSNVQEPSPVVLVPSTPEPPSKQSLSKHLTIQRKSPVILASSSPEMSYPTSSPSLADCQQDQLLAILQNFFPEKPNVKFKSEGQRQMVQEAISRRRNFVAILPTGGGKSLVFMLPAFLEDGYLTIVLVPNKMLLRDHVRNTKKANIQCMPWTVDAKPKSDIKIYFVALESAASRKFNM